MTKSDAVFQETPENIAFVKIMSEFDIKRWSYEAPCRILRAAIEFGHVLIEDRSASSFLAFLSSIENHQLNGRTKYVTVYARNTVDKTLTKYCYIFSQGERV